MTKPPIILSRQDRQELLTLINSARLDSRVPLESLIALEGELARAIVVEPADVPPDVVTMNSVVAFIDLATGEEDRYTLVYPRDANSIEDKISIFAPIGTALLGYRVGDTVQWRVPAGVRQLEITCVENQQSLAGARAG